MAGGSETDRQTDRKRKILMKRQMNHTAKHKLCLNGLYDVYNTEWNIHF